MALPLPQESRLAFNVPAILTNRFSVTSTTHGIRIAFGEIAPGETKSYQFHSAIIVTHKGAEDLRDAIIEILAQVKPPSSR